MPLAEKSRCPKHPSGGVLAHDALPEAGCEQIFIDKAPGKLTCRPELDKALLVALRPGDQLVVTKLDRLGQDPPACGW
jgi:DNA invertase Pin-like site-specific DNA recombinase